MVRRTNGWHFWVLLAAGSCIGPVIMVLFAAYRSTQTGWRSGVNLRNLVAAPHSLLYLAAGVSFLTTLFFLLFLRRAQRTRNPKRIGFMTGQLAVPEDFDRMHDEEIERLFDGRPDS